MKTIFHRERLLAKLKKAQAFIPKKPIIPAHEVFLFEIKDGFLAITATDGEKQITTWCEVIKSDGNISFTIPAKLLTHTLGLLLEEEVTFTYKSDKVELKCGKSKYKMYCEDGSTYPRFNHIEPLFEASFTGASFNEAIEIAKRYANADSPSTALQGVCFRMVDNKINVFGANGFSMAKIVSSPRSVNKWDDILVLVTAMNAVGKCIDDGDIVDITHNKDRIEIKTDEVSIICAAINMKYPDVDEFFRKRSDTFITLNTIQFLHALQRADQYTDKEMPVITLDIKTTCLSINVENTKFNRGGVDEIDCMATEEVAISVNSGFLINVMESFSSDTFNLYYSNAKKPIYIEPSNVLRDNNRFFLVAPLIV